MFTYASKIIFSGFLLDSTPDNSFLINKKLYCFQKKKKTLFFLPNKKLLPPPPKKKYSIISALPRWYKVRIWAVFDNGAFMSQSEVGCHRQGYRWGHNVYWVHRHKWGKRSHVRVMCESIQECFPVWKERFSYCKKSFLFFPGPFLTKGSCCISSPYPIDLDLWSNFFSLYPLKKKDVTAIQTMSRHLNKFW